jgi:hypothetical protein
MEAQKHLNNNGAIETAARLAQSELCFLKARHRAVSDEG